VFDGGNYKSDLGAASIDAAKHIPRPERPHFIVSNGGNETIIGSKGNNLIEVMAGNHTITSLGGTTRGANQYQILSGNDVILDFDYTKDSLYLPTNAPITGQFSNTSAFRGTILTYTGFNGITGVGDMNNSKIYLQGVDLTPVHSSWSWLQWSS
jgi:hypothetical protein